MSDKKITDQDYLFLSAMVKARESKMLTTETYERMLSAQSYEDAAKILVDCGYEDMSRMSSAQVEKALNDRRAAIFADIAARAPEKGAAEAFMLKYDYHNAKVILKSRAEGVSGEHMLSESGRVSPKVMAEAYDNDDYRFLPGLLGSAMAEARGILARTNNPQLADFCLDRAYFAELGALAKNMGGSFLEKYAAVLVDGANMRAAVRTVRMGRGIEFMKTAMVEGGSASPERVMAAAVNENLTELYDGTVYAGAAKLGDEAAKGGALTAFEMACDNAVTAFLKSAKLVSFGDAPVIAYLAAVENECTNLRMVLTGRLAGIAPENIRERLRKSYA
ncbi:MAG: V-type ATPase subunit [Candidatus Heteroscillospira sp.]